MCCILSSAHCSYPLQASLPSQCCSHLGAAHRIYRCRDPIPLLVRVVLRCHNCTCALREWASRRHSLLQRCVLRESPGKIVFVCRVFELTDVRHVNNTMFMNANCGKHHLLPRKPIDAMERSQIFFVISRCGLLLSMEAGPSHAI